MTNRIVPLTYDAVALKKSAERVRRDVSGVPALGIIAGSGIASTFDDCTHRRIPFRELPLLPQSTVTGHRNELLLAHLDGYAVVILAGRFHLYEGYSPADIALPVVLLHALGIRRILLTNAAGGLNPTLQVGDLLLSRSLVNMTFCSLAHDQSQPALELDNHWRQATLSAAARQGLCLREGTYVAVHGPSYETRAEVRFYRMLGDCIGMSTIHEAQAARALGMELLVVSIITNTLTENMPLQPLSHAEVLAATTAASTKLQCLIHCALSTAPHGH